MKRLSCIPLSLFWVIILLTGCENDEVSTTGTLRVSFINHSPEMRVHISSVENEEIVIQTLNVYGNGNAQTVLNIGNYYVRVFSSTFYSPKGFQIRSDQTTSIIWGANNDSHIE